MSDDPRLGAELSVHQHAPDRGPGQDDGREPEHRSPSPSQRTPGREELRQEQHDCEQRRSGRASPTATRPPRRRAAGPRGARSGDRRRARRAPGSHPSGRTRAGSSRPRCAAAGVAISAPTIGNADAAGKNRKAVQGGSGTALMEGEPKATAATPSAKPASAHTAKAQTATMPARLFTVSLPTCLSCAFARPLSWGRSPDAAGKSSRRAARAGRIAPVAVKRILAVPEPTGRALTWAREAADRFEAELDVVTPGSGRPGPGGLDRARGERPRQRPDRALGRRHARPHGVPARQRRQPRLTRRPLQRRLRGRRLGAGQGGGAARAPARPRDRDRPRLRAARAARRPSRPQTARAGCARRSRSSARRSPSSARCSRRAPTCCLPSTSPSSRGCRTTCRRSRRPRS